MDVSIVRRGPNYIELEIADVDFGVTDSLQEVLTKQEDVEYAGSIPVHPLSNKIRFIIRTKGEVNPEDALERGLTVLSDLAHQLRAELERVLK